MIRTLVHYSLHLLFPMVIARLFFKPDWARAYAIMLATMLIDLDHLLASPVFQANRCSIGFHPLHTWPAFIVYFVLLLLPRNFRIVGAGLCLHMLTDYIDCLMLGSLCTNCASIFH
jgi:cell shape-determining protein MreD